MRKLSVSSSLVMCILTLYTGYDYVRKGIDHAINEDIKISMT